MSLSTIEDPVFRAEYDIELRLKYPDPGDDLYTGPGSQFDRGVQHALSLQRGESRDAYAHKELTTQQAGQLWALQSHVDRACNDAAIYRGRCQKHDDVLQASDRKLLDLQRQLKLAKSRMISLQSSSMEAENETRQLKLSNHRVQKGLQASKDLCASLQYELSQRNASQSRHVDELNTQLENVNKELSLLQGTRSAQWQCLQADLKAKDGQLEARDQQPSDLRGQLSKQHGQVEQLQAQVDSLCDSVKGSSEDKAGDQKRRGHVVHIAATAGPLSHHQHSASGIPSHEEGHSGSGDHGGASGDHEAGPGSSDSTNNNSAPSRDRGSSSGDWRGGAGGYDGVSSSPEMPRAEPFDYQQGSQLHSEASQVPYSDCTDCESESELPPWEEDSPSLSNSGQQLSVGEQEWAAELDASTSAHDE